MVPLWLPDSNWLEQLHKSYTIKFSQDLDIGELVNKYFHNNKSEPISLLIHI